MNMAALNEVCVMRESYLSKLVSMLVIFNSWNYHKTDDIARPVTLP